VTIAVLASSRSSALSGIAAALEEALGAPKSEVATAEVAVALDPEALARAVSIGTPTRIAWVGSTDPDWEGALGGAHSVIAAHPALVPACVAMGAPRSRVHVGAFVAAGPRPGRAAARAALGIGDADAVVVVPTSVVAEDLGALLVQLALAREGPRFLFDVGKDAAAARALRRRATISAHMFAEGETEVQAWAAADRALVRLDGIELAVAIGRGVAPILAPPRGVDHAVARALAAAGIAEVASSDVTLSIAIDQACARESLDRAKGAIGALDLPAGAAKLAAAIRAAIEAARTQADDGLPRGLEKIGPGEDAAVPARPSPGPGNDDIDAELEALRARIAKAPSGS
jgi:hypothetical protein